MMIPGTLPRVIMRILTISHLDHAMPILGITEHNYLGVALDEENEKAYILIQGADLPSGYKFIILKQDFLDNSFSLVFTGDADAWNINTWGATMQKCYNPQIIDGVLIWTDNVNDINGFEVSQCGD